MSVVLFSRRIVCAGRFSSCLPLTIKPHPPFFTFQLFSPLSSNVISDFLTEECGFSSSHVTTVMRRKPQLLRIKSDHNAREVIYFLEGSGFTENKLKSIIIKSPNILSRKVDSQLKPTMEFLKKMGLTTQDIAHIIYHRPRLLELSLDNCLGPRVLHLETLFDSKVHLCKAFRRVPALLTSDFEEVKAKVEYVKNNIGIREGSAALVRGLNAVIGQCFETLEKKIKHMASLGLSEEEIGHILKRNPEVLTISTKKTKENFDFLIHTAGLEHMKVALNPVLLNLSVEKRLKPRYEAFKSLRTSPHAKVLPSLTKFFMLGEQDFFAKFNPYNTQVKPNDYTISKASLLEQ